MNCILKRRYQFPVTISLILLSSLFSNIMFAQSKAAKQNSNETADYDDVLLNQYIESKGKNTISFDPTNIKQFWIDNSVVSKGDFFTISLNASRNSVFESIPLKIQLTNVNEAMNCNIEIIADTDDFQFSITDSRSNVISTSSLHDDFLQYKVASSDFYLFDTVDYSFNVKITSKTHSSISIKRITLFFSENKDKLPLAPRKVLTITGNDVTGGENKVIHEKDNSFSVSGKRFGVFLKDKLVLNDRSVLNSVTVKNIGDKPVNIYFGYVPYTKDGRRIQSQNTLYKESNKILTVISFEANSNRIIVDSSPDWEKGCYLALNAKENLSDFPNFSITNATISEVNKIDENHFELLLDAPIKNQIIPGTKVRVQSKAGASYLYTNTARLIPGQEITLSSSTKRDDTFLQYSPKAFCRGIYQVVPVILSYSVDPKEENTILISNFSVEY